MKFPSTCVQMPQICRSNEQKTNQRAMETESKLESPLNYKHTPEFWELTNFFFCIIAGKKGLFSALP